MEETVQQEAHAVSDSAYAFAPFKRAAVLGAGTMGAQIAAHLANVGLHVDLLDIPGKDSDDPDEIARAGLSRAKKIRPNPFFTTSAADRIFIGNFEQDFDRLRDADWVLEAVVERMDIKRSLMERVEAAVGENTIVSTNTSGLSIAEIASGRSEAFRRRFLGTHFFNPPRYLKLLELVPSADTDPEVVARMAHFGRVHLGKGIVIARDTPYFIGNRIGVYAMLQAMREFTDGEFSIEEIDALTGTLVGRPRSATFRTADVVGLDVMLNVADNLFEAVPDDESREAFVAPDLLRRLVEHGRLGQKSGAGFYRKEGKEIKSVDPGSLEYRSPESLRLPELETIDESAGLQDRLRKLFDLEGRAGDFFRRTTLDLLAYSARRIPEITDSPADIDRAMRWGFGWELGPFQIWDALGFERVKDAMEERGIALPSWIDSMSQGDKAAFYSKSHVGSTVYVPVHGRYEADPAPADTIDVATLKAEPEREIWSAEDCALLDIGDGVALFEFRSKANTLGRAVIEGLIEAIDRIEADRAWRGMVIGNDGKNFSVGANLFELASAVRQGSIEIVDGYLRMFQTAMQRVRYAAKPVVVAAHQRVLGGGCELLMASTHPVAAAESYIGLVELGVGLIPAASGSTRLAALAARRTPNGHPSEIQPWLRKFFETVAMSTVSTSAREAQELGFLPPHARIVMNDDRRLFVARELVRQLSNEGYYPPPRRTVKVLGEPTQAALAVMVQQYVEGRFISEYDAFLANRLAFVMTGGELTAPQEVSEEYLLELERQVFLELVQQPKTQARIEHMLKTKQPLRN